MASRLGSYMGALGDDSFSSYSDVPGGALPTFDASGAMSDVPGGALPTFASDLPSFSTTVVSPPPGMVGSAILSQLPGMFKTAENILSSQYGGPKPGQYFATSPNGQSVAYSLPAGSTSTTFGITNPFSGGSASSFLPILLLLGGGALLLTMLKGK